MADQTASTSKGKWAFSRERFEQEVAEELGIDLAGPIGRRAQAVSGSKAARTTEPSTKPAEVPPER